MRFAFVLIYFAVLIFIGIVSARKIRDNDDFFIGGKRAGTLLITGSLTATILGSSAILGTANMAYNMGYSAMWWLLCAFMGLLILYPFAGKVRRYGNYSFPELIGYFYGRDSFYISSVIIPVAWIGIISAQIIGSAKILNSFLGIDYAYGAVGSGLIFIVYTYIGGQTAILKTDIFQSLLIVLGISYLFFHIVFVKGADAFAGFSHSFPFSEGFGLFDLVILFLTLSTTYFVGPDIYSRLFCSRDEKTANKSVIITSLVILVFSFIIVYIGVYAGTVFEFDTQRQAVIVEISFLMLPEWAIGLMVAGLLSAIMSSADTTILTASTIISELFCIKSKKNFMKITRVFIILLGVSSIIFSLYVQNIIASLLVALTIFSGAFVIPTLAGISGYRAGRLKVNTAVIAGGLIALTGKVIQMKIQNNTGNLIIASAFLINAVIIFFPSEFKISNKRKTN